MGGGGREEGGGAVVVDVLLGGAVGVLGGFEFDVLVFEVLAALGDDEIDGLVDIAGGVDFHGYC